MLKWADETRRKLDSIDNDSHIADNNNADSNKSNKASTTSEGSWSDDESAIFITAKSSSPLQKRQQKRLQTSQQRRRHSSCCQLYASPEQIVLGWNSKETQSQRKVGSNSVPTTPTDNSNAQFPDQTENNNNNHLSQSKTLMNQNDSNKISTKPELLQITTKQGDKNRQSFWKNLMGKKSWPSRTYKSPMRKSHSVVETYRKIDESYYIESEETDRRTSDYGLSRLAISCNTPNDPASNDGERSPSYHSLKTIRRQNECRRPKLFTKHSTGRNKSPDSGFSDIRLSMSVADEFDCERDSGVPRSPTLSSTSSSSDDSACYRKH